VENCRLEITARICQQEGNQQSLQGSVADLAHRLQDVASSVSAMGHVLASPRPDVLEAIAVVTGSQEKLAQDIQTLLTLVQTVAGGVTSVTQEQAAAHRTWGESSRVLATTIETVQQSLKTIETEVVALGQTGEQTATSLTAMAAEQIAVHETVRDTMEKVTDMGTRQAAVHETVATRADNINTAITGLIASQEHLTGAFQALRESAQTAAGVLTETARGQSQAYSVIQGALTATAEAVAAMRAEQTSMHETVRCAAEDLTRVGARQAALGEAVQTHGQAMSAAATTLVASQGQLAGEIQGLQELSQMVTEAVRNIAQQQAAVGGVVEDNTRLLTAVAEAIQQGDRMLQMAIEETADTVRRTTASMMAAAAEQTTGWEAVPRPIGPVVAAPAVSPESLPDDILRIQAPAPTAGDSGPREAESIVSVAQVDHVTRLLAAQAIVHGEQIRYEIGLDRDNLGFWNKASEWAEWGLEVVRPGRFQITVEIAALASSRFQVLFADQRLEGTAPNTGDYGRFQKVELGIVEVTSCGQSRVVVQPLPEGWQPINLKMLEVTMLLA
jgi:hypothetical protein